MKGNDFIVKVGRNELIGRLLKLQDEMTDRNDHGEAFLVGLAVEALRDQPGGFTQEQIEAIRRIAAGGDR